MSKAVSWFLVLMSVAAVPPRLVSADAQRWKAGSAEVVITPREMLWLAGFGDRNRPADGTGLDLYAKALVLEDYKGTRAVLVTADLENLPDTVSKHVADRIQKQFAIPRERLMLNASHTHCSPVTDRREAIVYDMTPEQWSAVDRYVVELEDKLVAVIGKALQDLRPARLSFGITTAGFAANRREKPPGAASQEGPVDHDVPFLKVEGRRARVRSIVFGYACHNTTLVGDYYKYSGDYAGYAQKWLEKYYPGARALFVQGCGGDANAKPRGTVEVALQHGGELAAAVEKALRGPSRKVAGPLKSVYEEIPLALAPPPNRQELQARLALPGDENKWVRRNAQQMLGILDRDGRLPTEVSYPMQVWQFGPDLTLVALAGECVADYSLRLKKELGREQLWVAGYSNDTAFAYIPSLRVLQEGGYEGGEANLLNSLPGPFTPSVEETIIKKVHELVEQVGAKPQPAK